MEKQDCFLTRNETNFIKAVAIIMMLMHHFWGFPAWRVGGAALEPAIYLPGGASLSWMAALQFKICVAMFAVITGYGWGKGQVSLRKAAQRIGKVLLAYEWCLAAEYILNELAAPGSVSLRDLPDQITLCFFHGELLIRFAWYVRFFILAAFSYLAFVRLMRACPNRLVQGLIAVAPFWAVYYCLSRWAAPCLQYGDVPDYLTYMPCVMIGTWIADSRYPVWKRRKVSAAASLFWVAVCAALLYARYYASSRAYLDVFLAPCLIRAFQPVCRLWPGAASEMLRSAGRPRHLHVAAPLPPLPDPWSGAVPEYPISLKKPAPRIPVGLPHRISRRLPPALPRRNSVGVGITPQPQKPAQIKTGRLLFLRGGRSNPLNLRVILRVILRTLLYQLPVSDANAIPPIFCTGAKASPAVPFPGCGGQII